MTDDEIDAAIRAVVPAECFVPNTGARAIFRAGMREAARIARDGLLPAVRDWDLGYNAALRAASAAIERAAGGEG